MGIFDKLFGGGGSSPSSEPPAFDPASPPLIDGAAPRYAYTMNVAGVAVRQDAIWENVSLGKYLTFDREPDNKHDPDAVKVMCDGSQVGYVPASRARMAADWLDSGKRLVGIVTEESEWEDDRGRELIGVQMWLGYYDTDA